MTPIGGTRCTGKQTTHYCTHAVSQPMELHRGGFGDKGERGGREKRSVVVMACRKHQSCKRIMERGDAINYARMHAHFIFAVVLPFAACGCGHIYLFRYLCGFWPCRVWSFLIRYETKLSKVCVFCGGWPSLHVYTGLGPSWPSCVMS